MYRFIDRFILVAFRSCFPITTSQYSPRKVLVNSCFSFVLLLPFFPFCLYRIWFSDQPVPRFFTIDLHWDTYYFSSHIHFIYRDVFPLSSLFRKTQLSILGNVFLHLPNLLFIFFLHFLLGFSFPPYFRLSSIVLSKTLFRYFCLSFKYET